jgi:hypothetical protein
MMLMMKEGIEVMTMQHRPEMFPIEEHEEPAASQEE